jgi:hypothetical protein
VTRLWWFVVVCLWVTSAAPAARVVILSSPGIVSDGYARIMVYVPRAPENDQLAVALMDGEFTMRRSDRTLYRTRQSEFEYEWQNLSPCHCVLIAALFDARQDELDRDVRPMLVR